APLGNTGDGVVIASGPTANTVGGTAAGNVISANGGNGVVIRNATGNVVQANFIGTDVNGTAALGNHFDGVRFDNGGNGNTIGAGNILSGNGRAGLVLGGDGNTVLGNNFMGTDVNGTAALP